MFETSKDVLFITLSFCVVFFTAFICWTIFYLGSLLKQSNEMLKEFRDKLDELYETISEMKERVTNSVSQISNIAAGVGQIIDYFAQRKKSKRTRRH